MIEAPIFHVNGDDPEAVVFCAKIATEFRQKFHKPVVIDMFCYRRFGHNEGDEPSFTQPLMYQKIRAHPTTLQIYSEKLEAEGVLGAGDLDRLKAGWRSHLEGEYEGGQSYKPNKADWLDGKWSGFKVADQIDDPRRGNTGVPIDQLKEIGRKRSPGCRKTSIRIEPLRASWRRARKRSKPAKASTGRRARRLLSRRCSKRATSSASPGRDVERGTFSQRHSVLLDQENEDRYIPLNHVREGQPKFEVLNSMLSEEAVLGFEYGFSLAEPKALTVWEAQFGDFANGAQVVIDQFISSGERKWLRMSGLVMLLPHGYEGQGPEHSSARLERYLQLCAEDNMQVANCSTPANYFHILRRQMKRDFRNR